MNEFKNIKILPEVYIEGCITKKTENFSLTIEGHIRLSVCNKGYIYIDDYDFTTSQVIFRGDKVNYSPFLERLEKEGYVDLVKELTDLKDNIFIKDLTLTSKKRLKEIFVIDEIIFKEDLVINNVNLVTLDSYINSIKNSAVIKKQYCNNHLGFTFPPEELIDNVSLEELENKYAELVKINPKIAKIFENGNKRKD